jgi:hypothetical protein
MKIKHRIKFYLLDVLRSVRKRTPATSRNGRTNPTYFIGD